jgi:hypothetical protein
LDSLLFDTEQDRAYTTGVAIHLRAAWAFSVFKGLTEVATYSATGSIHSITFVLISDIDSEVKNTLFFDLK